MPSFEEKILRAFGKEKGEKYLKNLESKRRMMKEQREWEKDKTKVYCEKCHGGTRRKQIKFHDYTHDEECPVCGMKGYTFQKLYTEEEVEKIKSELKKD